MSTPKIPARTKSSASKKASKKKAPKTAKTTGSKKPPLRLVGKPPKSKPADGEPVSKADAATGDELAPPELRELAEKGDKKAIEMLNQIVGDFNSWRSARSAYKRVVKDASDAIKKEEVAFEQSIEDPLPAGKPGTLALEKLERVELRWQELKETKMQWTEDKKEAKSKLSKAAKALDQSVHDSAQLKFDFRSGKS